MNTKKIGILGGMGPRATARFESKLISRIKGSDQQMPSIISVNNGNIPDRTKFILGTGDDPLDVLANEALILQRSNVNVVCMPCNTAHSPKILARLMAQVPLPIIDMPSACMLYIESKGYSKALILGTEGTKRERIFELRSTSCECVYPNTEDQNTVSQIIENLKNGNSLTKEQTENLKKLCLKAEADIIVLACTELSLISQSALSNFNIIDSTDILIDSCIEILERS